MASCTDTISEQPFRFLDLPTDLRCCVYEHIEIPATRHSLDRTQALIRKPDWPVLPKSQIYDSRITLIQPHTKSATNLLATCRLVNKEASYFLSRKIQQARRLPVQYLVDYSAVFALVKPNSVLRSCLGMAGAGISQGENTAVKSFLRVCALTLSRTRPARNRAWDGTQSGSRGVRAIEITITYRRDAVHSREVMEAVVWLSKLTYLTPTRVVVIYQSPLPRILMPGSTQVTDSGFLEQMLQQVPRELEISNLSWGVFIRPLKEADFERHVEGLDSSWNQV
ncbi:hypothetical protein C7974DRAFT_442607 [Boeremia exigua]|uniref:uncharacterized protein n=1 Tax=Boeremia exigua TaxID=749465 RepID=UPI001E8ECA11|nr:uncharacterized protein C7974DRAFT_442607 [Boeremia exigua]KAH6616796.1 hypothetical protein C7974DRAFT_442607 [Boeremia exigua]